MRNTATDLGSGFRAYLRKHWKPGGKTSRIFVLSGVIKATARWENYKMVGPVSFFVLMIQNVITTCLMLFGSLPLIEHMSISMR